MDWKGKWITEIFFMDLFCIPFDESISEKFISENKKASTVVDSLILFL